MGASIVACRQRSKSLLASCVPDLELDVLIVELYGFYFEVYSDRVEEVLIE